jgi:hypothetical protein
VGHLPADRLIGNKGPREIYEVPVGPFGVILRDGSSRRYATHLTNTNKLCWFRHFHTFLNLHYEPPIAKNE